MSNTKRSSLTTVVGSNEHLVEIATRKRSITRKRRNYLLKTVPVLIIVSLVFFVLYLVVQIKYSKLLAEEICTSRDCIESSVTIRDAMDLEQDPCENFYAYACGNFPIAHPISEDSQLNSWFHEGELRLSRMVEQVLMNVNNLNDSQYKLMGKTRNFFRSCLDLKTLEQKGLAPLYDLLERLGLPKFPTKETAKTFNLGKTVGLIQSVLGNDVLVQCSIDRGIVRSSLPNDTFMMQVSPISHLGVLSAVLSDPADLNMAVVLPPSKELLLRITFMDIVMRNIVDDLQENYGFEYEFNSTTFSNQALKVISFTDSLRMMLLESLNNTAENETDYENAESMTFKELQNILDPFSPSDSVSNRINWADFLAGFNSGDDEGGYWIYDYSLDNVSVKGLEIFKDFTTFLGAAHPLTVQRYVWWTIVFDYAKHTNKEMRSVYTEFYDALYGVKGETSRFQTCVSNTRTRLHPILALPIRNHFELAKDTTKVSEMLKFIQAEFQSIVDSLNWMDSQTKQATIKKCMAIMSHLGYEKAFLDEEMLIKHYEELQFDEKEYIGNIIRMQSWKVRKVKKLFKQSNSSAGGSLNTVAPPLQVNAFYAPELNTIFVPAGILQKPFYYRGLESLNYGAIGSILGHELTHGFDSEGKDFDIDGNKQEDLWSPEVTQNYEDRAQCFVKQYSQFCLDKEKRLNGTYTLAENIADNGGLRESYYAYQSFVKRNGREPKLPGFENYTHEQLFFLSFANIWCEGFSEAARQARASRKDPHSPNRIRVVATLQNMKEFAQAFSCPRGSFMNPPNKCVLW